MGFADGVAWRLAEQNGRKMGLPFIEQAAQNDKLLWIRQDWLDAVGMSAPSTVEGIARGGNSIRAGGSRARRRRHDAGHHRLQYAERLVQLAGSHFWRLGRHARLLDAGRQWRSGIQQRPSRDQRGSGRIASMVQRRLAGAGLLHLPSRADRLAACGRQFGRHHHVAGFRGALWLARQRRQRPRRPLDLRRYPGWSHRHQKESLVKPRAGYRLLLPQGLCACRPGIEANRLVGRAAAKPRQPLPRLGRHGLLLAQR